ncbi:MAG: membrane protein insertase YidC [Candidatus Omnitrophota bacterium]
MTRSDNTGKRALLAFGLSMLVIVFFSYIQTKNQPPKTVPTQTPPPVTSDLSPISKISPPSKEEPSLPPAKEVIVETGLYRAVFDSRGGRLISLGLKHYTRKNEPWLETLSPDSSYPFGIEGENEILFVPDKESLALSPSQTSDAITFRARKGKGTITKKFTFDNRKYGIAFELAREGLTEEKTTLTAFSSPQSLKKNRTDIEEILVSSSGKISRIRPGTIKNEAHQVPGTGYLGRKTQYILTFLKPEKPLDATISEGAAGKVVSSFILKPGQAKENFYFYSGPADQPVLTKEGVGIGEILPTGPIVALNRFIMGILTFFHRLLPNWGVAIILLTILFKIVFFPLTRVSLRTMKTMQKLQPYMKDLSKKYKDNPQAMQKEIFGIYRQYRINPLSGCLPMLVQVPIFIAIFTLLRTAIVLRGAKFCLWINDLSLPDKLFVLNVRGSELPVNILPFLMGGTMFFQQKLSSASTTGMAAEQQKMMTVLMPVMLTVFLYNLPAGLMLYWTVTNLISIAEQEINTRRL